MVNYLDKISAEKCLIFNTLVRYGSVSTAAKALKIPVSKVHNELKSIEKAMGSPILLRDKRKILLTPLGTRFADFCRVVTEGLKHLDQSFVPEEALDLNIATSHGWAESLLPEILAKFHMHYPTVKVNIFSGAEYLDFTQQDIDIVMGMPITNRADITKTYIADYTYAFYASKDYLARKGTPQSFNDFVNHDFIEFRGSSILEQNTKNMSLNVVATSTNYRALLELTRRGLGICFLCKDFLKFGFYSNENLVSIIPEYEHKSVKVCFMSRKFSHKSTSINALLEATQEVIRAIFGDQQEVNK